MNIEKLYIEKKKYDDLLKVLNTIDYITSCGGAGANAQVALIRSAVNSARLKDADEELGMTALTVTIEKLSELIKILKERNI